MFKSGNKINFNNEDEDDDMYGGFNSNSVVNAESLFQNENIQQAIRQTSYGRKKTAQVGFKGMQGSTRMQTGRMQTGARLGTSFTSNSDGARPITAVKAAGFSTRLGDRFNESGPPPPPLESKPEDTPEEKVKKMERKVNTLIEESCIAAANGDHALALDKAKEAGQKEKVLVRQRDQMSIADQINLDLTYSVLFNLANQYSVNEMYQDALAHYQSIVKNKMFAHAGRLKVNMGNIYFKMKNYSKAIKMYRMGLDQVPGSHRSMRLKIMQNIGLSFVKLGQYQEAISSFENIIQEEPDHRTALNLILCYYAKGDRVKMKAAFRKLLSVDLKLDDEDRYLSHNDDKQYELILEVIRNDDLKKFEESKKTISENCIKMAAKLIAPEIEADFNVGYNWCIDEVKMSLYNDVAHNLEIDKAIMYLKLKDFNQGYTSSVQMNAIETLKSFERKDTKFASTAATNLSFLYFLEGNIQQADKYADVALNNDRYNSAALVNKGNVLFQQREYEKAREYYNEALQNDISCVEALYNLGLSEKCLTNYEDALDHFMKLNAILKSNPSVIYQIGDLYMKLEDVPNQSMEWFMQLHSIVPTDSKLLQRLGDIYDEEGDKPQAFSVYVDSFKYFPSNLEVIEWLGAYFIETQFCEKAISYFEKAAMMQPNQVKWLLMIASCHRRSGNYQQALETYKAIHRSFPDNVECLQFMVRIYQDMGLPEAKDYMERLHKVERQKEAREQRIAAGLTRRGSSAALKIQGSRENSAGSATNQGNGYVQENNDTGNSRENSANGPQRRQRTKHRKSHHTPDNDDWETMDNTAQDVSYSDPLGPEVERPKTAVRGRGQGGNYDEFANEELDDNLLPD